jgi:hypothetical protein
MKLLAAVLVAAAATLAGCTPMKSPSYVEYQGHKLLASKYYEDFDDYKEDQNNLPGESLRMADALVRKAPFGPKFSSSDVLLKELFQIQFPGYGMFFANQVGSGFDPQLEIAYVEIPGGRFNRHFVLGKDPGGAYEVIDDFVAPQVPEIARVRKTKNGALEYSRVNGEVVVPARHQALFLPSSEPHVKR